MTTTQTNPGRPPKHWMRRCIKGVTKSKSAADPGAVCGSLWHHKLSESQRRAILREERAMGGLVENPVCPCENPERESFKNWKQEVLDFLAELSHDDRLSVRGGGRKTETVRRAARQILAGDRRGVATIQSEAKRISYNGTIGRVVGRSPSEAITIAEIIEQTPDSAVVAYRRRTLDPYYEHGRTQHNPTDPYQTWLMGVRRQLQRTGYPEAAGRLSAHERDLRGIYLSGAGTTDAARVVTAAYQRGDFAANPIGTGGVLLAIGAALGIGAVVYYFATRDKKEEKPAGSLAPGGKRLIPPPPPPPACVIDEGKLHVFAQAKGLLSVYLPACSPATPPVQNQPAPPFVACWDEPAPPTWAALWTTVLKTPAQTVPIVLVLRDGSFWTYGGSPPVASVRPDLRAEYCQFSFTFSPDLFPNLKGADPASAFIL